MTALADASVIAGLIPGCSFYLGVAQAPARKLIERGIPVAWVRRMKEAMLQYSGISEIPEEVSFTE